MMVSFSKKSSGMVILFCLPVVLVCILICLLTFNLSLLPRLLCCVINHVVFIVIRGEMSKEWQHDSG